MSYLGAFGKRNLLCHVLDIFPFLQLAFFSGNGFAHTGRYKPKTKRVCTLFKSSGSIYFLHKQLSRKELRKDAAESWKVWLTYATASGEASLMRMVMLFRNERRRCESDAHGGGGSGGTPPENFEI